MSRPPGGSRSRAAAALVSAAVIAAVLLAAYVFVSASRGKPMNPYEYDLKAFLDVPQKLMLYDEGPSIETSLETPSGIAVDGEDRIYVVGGSAVAVFDKAANVLRRINLSEPGGCLAVGKDGALFVGLKDHVEVYDAGGSPQAVWTSLGEQALITGIAAGGQDVFVADFGSRLVWRFDTSGRLVSQIGAADAVAGVPGFILPSPYFDLALDADGALWVADPGRLRVEKYTYGGGFKGAWGKASMAVEGFCGCCNPTNIAVAPDGSFVTSEKGLPRVKVYGAGGEFTGVVAAPRQFAEGTVGLDLAVDSSGRVLVLDPKAGAVRVFTRKAPGAGEERK